MKGYTGDKAFNLTEEQAHVVNENVHEEQKNIGRIPYTRSGDDREQRDNEDRTSDIRSCISDSGNASIK